MNSQQASVFAVKAQFINISVWVSEIIKSLLIFIFNMVAKMTLLCSEQHIFLYGYFIVWVSKFYMYLCLLEICSNYHNEHDCQNSLIMLRTAYFSVCSPQVLLYGSQISIHISDSGPFLTSPCVNMDDDCTQDHVRAYHTFMCRLSVLKLIVVIWCGLLC